MALRKEEDDRRLTWSSGRRSLRTSSVSWTTCAVPPAAAIGVLRGRLTGESGTEILDLISSIALDAERLRDVRLAALDALSELPRHVVQPLLQQAGIGDDGPAAAAPGAAAFDDPTSVTEWITANAAASLSVLHNLVLDLRERERREPSARTRQRWALARGAVHSALARRGSRVALYDIRERGKLRRLGRHHQTGEALRAERDRETNPDEICRIRLTSSPTSKTPIPNWVLGVGALGVVQVSTIWRTRREPWPATRTSGRSSPSPVRLRTEYS